jgi:dihydrofolate reductase
VACVIGGERIFAAALPLAAGLIMTEIKQDFAGDARFPDYDRSRWQEKQREAHTAANGMRFDFVQYEKA